MLPSLSQSQDWFSSEPLLFDEDFCQSLMKDLQALPTPPQSPPLKVGHSPPVSKEDELCYMSDILLDDQDLRLTWTSDLLHQETEPGSLGPAPSPEDCLWRCLVEDRLLGSSPLLSDMDTSIFQEIAGSTLDCQNLVGETTSDSQNPVGETTSNRQNLGETPSDCELSTSSDSEEEIDVVTVVRCPSDPAPELSWRHQKQEEERRARQRHHAEIQLLHNYAAPCPASPPPSNKRTRGGDAPSSRVSTETEDEEERRRTHNVMERQRRNELKNCFLRLRDAVPEVMLNDKASKVVILRTARDCVAAEQRRSSRLQSRKLRLRRRQEQLKARLHALRS